MRPIKFRGKRCDNGEWAYGYYARLSNEFKEWHCIMTEKDASENYIKDCNGYNMLYTPVNHSTVGQFTGLYDKNGEEIYEGDMVKTKFYGKDYDNINVADFDIFVVKFIDGCFRVVNVAGIRIFYLQDGCHFEIIGNIHDNPELLKGGEE